MKVLTLPNLIPLALAGSSMSADEIQASFDCVKATTHRKKTICSSMHLAKLDIRLAVAYKKVRQETDRVKLAIIKASQR